jgi:carbonic anhydrase
MLDDLLHANERYAEAEFGELPSLPRRGLVILTCMDHRVDPLAALGLEPGDAMVLRNAGGRVTPAFLRDLRILELVAAKRGGSLGELELLLVQHTQCGAGGLAGEHHGLLAEHLGCESEELGTRSPADPYEGVRVDIELLAAEDGVPDSLAVAGLVYDVEDGRIELVERRAPLRRD